MGKKSCPTCLCIACAFHDVSFITVFMVTPAKGNLRKGLQIRTQEEADNSEGKYAKGLPGEDVQPLLTTDCLPLLVQPKHHADPTKKLLLRGCE